MLCVTLAMSIHFINGKYLEPNYFSSTLNLAIFCRQDFSIFLFFAILLKIGKILHLHAYVTRFAKRGLIHTQFQVTLFTAIQQIQQ